MHDNQQFPLVRMPQHYPAVFPLRMGRIGNRQRQRVAENGRGFFKVGLVRCNPFEISSGIAPLVEPRCLGCGLFNSLLAVIRPQGGLHAANAQGTFEAWAGGASAAFEVFDLACHQRRYRDARAQEHAIGGS